MKDDGRHDALPYYRVDVGGRGYGKRYRMQQLERRLAMAMKACPTCGKHLADSAEKCPRCGHNFTPRVVTWIVVALVVVVILIIVAGIKSAG